MGEAKRWSLQDPMSLFNYHTCIQYHVECRSIRRLRHHTLCFHINMTRPIAHASTTVMQKERPWLAANTVPGLPSTVAPGAQCLFEATPASCETAQAAPALRETAQAPPASRDRRHPASYCQTCHSLAQYLGRSASCVACRR